MSPFGGRNDLFSFPTRSTVSGDTLRWLEFPDQLPSSNLLLAVNNRLEENSPEQGSVGSDN